MNISSFSPVANNMSMQKKTATPINNQKKEVSFSSGLVAPKKETVKLIKRHGLEEYVRQLAVLLEDGKISKATAQEMLSKIKGQILKQQ